MAISYDRSLPFSLNFLGPNVVQQFFSDVPSLLKICSEDHIAIDMLAAKGWTKGFSTCLPHLVIITVFLYMAAITYLKLVSNSPSTMDLLVSILYIVVTPTLNPLLYSLRSQDIKGVEERVLELFYGTLLLVVYLVALRRNILIFALTALSWRLYTPLYLFLKNLTVSDLCYISVTVPKSVVFILTDRRSISLLGRVTQAFLLVILATSELFFLMAMSYYHYATIYHPLRYELIMKNTVCGKMVAASWLNHLLKDHVAFDPVSDSPLTLDMLVSVFYTGFRNHVARGFSPHLAPEVSPLGPKPDLQGFPSEQRLVYLWGQGPSVEQVWELQLVHAALFLLVFLVTLEGNLNVIAVATLDRCYMLHFDCHLILSFTVMPPALNLLIYSLRNRDLKAALRTVLKRKFPQTPL
ncbi:olfactory receptor 14K1-like [Tachyglossus aculeatus]|uniref:olfactory receptor 14K1-like n=1 Tax=Tachyglossus aculeatus TaxID=9261 RepID=UPI0018F5688A|nr:olfactory receptor 14K1-like [Tachyglossus aculeatus]